MQSESSSTLTHRRPPPPPTGGPVTSGSQLDLIHVPTADEENLYPPQLEPEAPQPAVAAATTVPPPAPARTHADFMREQTQRLRHQRDRWWQHILYDHRGLRRQVPLELPLRRTWNSLVEHYVTLQVEWLGRMRGERMETQGSHSAEWARRLGWVRRAAAAALACLLLLLLWLLLFSETARGLSGTLSYYAGVSALRQQQVTALPLLSLTLRHRFAPTYASETELHLAGPSCVESTREELASDSLVLFDNGTHVVRGDLASLWALLSEALARCERDTGGDCGFACLTTAFERWPGDSREHWRPPCMCLVRFGGTGEPVRLLRSEVRGVPLKRTRVRVSPPLFADGGFSLSGEEHEVRSDKTGSYVEVYWPRRLRFWSEPVALLTGARPYERELNLEDVLLMRMVRWFLRPHMIPTYVRSSPDTDTVLHGADDWDGWRT